MGTERFEPLYIVGSWLWEILKQYVQQAKENNGISCKNYK